MINDMTNLHKGIRYAAIAFAILLAVGIVGSIVTSLGMVLGFITGDGVTGETATYPAEGEVTSLELELGGADLEIKAGETLRVESNLKNLKVETKKGCLTIIDETDFGIYNGAKLTLYLPEGTVFEKVEISTGAGRLTVEELSAEKLSLELGAGEVIINRLTATESCEIDGGAGAITVKNGSLHDLSMDMGVGQLTMTASLTGVSDLDMGVGETELTLLGGKESYRVKINKGVGSAEVDGQSASDGETFGNGENRVTIDGGVGSIEVEFEE